MQNSNGIELLFGKREIKSPFRLYEIMGSENSFCKLPFKEISPELVEEKVKIGDKIVLNSILSNAYNAKSSYTAIYQLEFSINNPVIILEKGVYDPENNLFNVLLTEITHHNNINTNKYHKIFDEISEAVLLYHDNLIMDVNSAFCEIFGYERSDLIGKNVWDALPSTEKDPKLFEIQNLIQKDEKAEYQDLIFHNKKNGTRIYLSIKGGSLEIDGKNYRCIRVTDISSDLLSRKKLQETNNKYKHLLKSSKEGIIIHDKGIAIEANQRFCEITGKSEAEILGRSVTSFVIQEEVPRILEFIRENEINFDNVRNERTKIAHSSGVIIDIELWGNKIEIEGNPYRFVVIRDISEEIKARKIIELSEKRYKLLSDITEEIIVVHDNGYIVEVNRAACDFFELSENEIIGKHTIDVMTPDSVKSLGITKAMLEEAYRFDFENSGFYKKAKDGEEYSYQYREKLMYVDGKRLRFVIMRNLTNEMNAQAELQKSTQKYKRLAEITHEMLIIHDKGKIIEINKAACDYLKIIEEEAIGKNVYRLFNEELKHSLSIKENHENILLGEGLSTVKRNDKTYHIQFSEEIFDENGSNVRCIILRDITLLRESQLLLEENRNKYKLLSDTTNEAISICKDCKALEVNKAYCDLFQLNQENISGYNVLENLLPEDREVFENFNRMLSKVIAGIDTKDLKQESLRMHIIEKMHELIAEDTIVFPYELRENGSFVIPLKKRDGTIFMADYFDDYIIINGVIYQYQIIRDVTKSFDSSRKLEESNRKYKFFADATNEGIIIHRDGEIIEVNEAACRLFMKNENELNGIKILDLIVKYDSNDKNEKNNIRIFKKGKNGTFIAELWESSIGTEKDDLSYTVIRDITERIKNEERIENLVHNLSEKTKELNCLLELSRLNSNPNHGSFEDLINKSLEIISNGWQYPEICGVSIKIANKTYSNRVFKSEYQYISAPIVTGNIKIGLLRVFYTKRIPEKDNTQFTVGENSLIEALALQLGMIIEKKESDDRLLATVLETEDKERARLAKEVHDNLGQILMAVSLNLESLSKEINLLGSKNQNKLSNALHYLAQAIQESRELAHSLMPKAISDYGYSLAVQSLIDKFGAEELLINFYDNLEGKRLPANIELTLFRITQEALTNIIKHSEANEVTIQLMRHRDQLILSIEDNGKGFDYVKQKKYFGINSMKNRVTAISGIFTVETKPGMGTTIMIEIPI